VCVCLVLVSEVLVSVAELHTSDTHPYTHTYTSLSVHCLLPSSLLLCFCSKHPTPQLTVRKLYIKRGTREVFNAVVKPSQRHPPEIKVMLGEEGGVKKNAPQSSCNGLS